MRAQREGTALKDFLQFCNAGFANTCFNTALQMNVAAKEFIPSGLILPEHIPIIGIQTPPPNYSPRLPTPEDRSFESIEPVPIPSSETVVADHNLDTGQNFADDVSCTETGRQGPGDGPLLPVAETFPPCHIDTNGTTWTNEEGITFRFYTRLGWMASDTNCTYH